MKYNPLIIAVSVTLFSCSKSTVNDSSKNDALTNGTWKLTGLARDYNKDGTYEEDTYSMLEGCLKDNIFTFQPDGNMLTDEGPTKCYSSNPQTRTSPWNFTENKTKLQFDGVNYQIEELTAATLRLKTTISYNVIYTINQRETYTKQ